MRERDAVTHLRVIGAVARLHQRVLRVDDLERRRLAGLVPQHGQSQALGGEIGDVLERIRAGFRRQCFVVHRVEIDHELALRVRQRHLGLVPPRLALMQLAPEPAPVPDRHRQVDGDEVAEVWQHAELRLSGDLAVQRELVGFDPVHGLDHDVRKKRVFRRAHVVPRGS